MNNAMDATYNITAMLSSAQGGIAGLAQSTNIVLGGFYYGYFILFMVALITFIFLVSKGYQKPACFATACWMLSITALFLRPLNLIDSYAFWICIFATPIAIFVLWLSGRPEM
jgi:hypothetical protein